MGRPPKPFFPRQAQRLFRATLGQAIADILDPDVDNEIREDATQFLFGPDSDIFILSQGISDVENFRRLLRERMNAQTVSVWLEGRKPVTIERKAA